MRWPCHWVPSTCSFFFVFCWQPISSPHFTTLSLLPTSRWLLSLRDLLTSPTSTCLCFLSIPPFYLYNTFDFFFLCNRLLCSLKCKGNLLDRLCSGFIMRFQPLTENPNLYYEAFLWSAEKGDTAQMRFLLSSKKSSTGRHNVYNACMLKLRVIRGQTRQCWRSTDVLLDLKSRKWKQSPSNRMLWNDNRFCQVKILRWTGMSKGTQQ